jgi:hypothetical protein
MIIPYICDGDNDNEQSKAAFLEWINKQTLEEEEEKVEVSLVTAADDKIIEDNTTDLRNALSLSLIIKTCIQANKDIYAIMNDLKNLIMGTGGSGLKKIQYGGGKEDDIKNKILLIQTQINTQQEMASTKLRDLSGKNASIGELYSKTKGMEQTAAGEAEKVREAAKAAEASGEAPLDFKNEIFGYDVVQLNESLSQLETFEIVDNNETSDYGNSTQIANWVKWVNSEGESAQAVPVPAVPVPAQAVSAVPAQAAPVQDLSTTINALNTSIITFNRQSIDSTIDKGINEFIETIGDENIKNKWYDLASNLYTANLRQPPREINILSITKKCLDIFPNTGIFENLNDNIVPTLLFEDGGDVRPNIKTYILDYFGIPDPGNTLNLDLLNQLCIAALLENDDLISIIVSEFYYEDNDILYLGADTDNNKLIPLNSDTFTGLFFNDVAQNYDILTPAMIQNLIANGRKDKKTTTYDAKIKNHVLLPLISWLIKIYKPEQGDGEEQLESPELTELCSTITTNKDCVVNDPINVTKFTDILYNYLFVDNGLDSKGIIELNIGSVIPGLNLHQSISIGGVNEGDFSYSYNELVIIANQLKQILVDKNAFVDENGVPKKYIFAEYTKFIECGDGEKIETPSGDGLFDNIDQNIQLPRRDYELTPAQALRVLYLISTKHKRGGILTSECSESVSINDLLEGCLRVAITNPTNVNVARIYLLGEKIGQYMKDPDILMNDLNNAVYMTTGKDNENVQLFKDLSVNPVREQIGLLLDNFIRDEELQKQLFYVIANTPKPDPIPEYFNNIYSAYDAWIATETTLNANRKTAKDKLELDINAQKATAPGKGGSRWGRKQRIKITPLKSKSKSKKHMRHRHKTMRRQKHNQKSKHRKSIARNTKQRKHTIRQNIADPDSILVGEMVHDLIDE